MVTQGGTLGRGQRLVPLPPISLDQIGSALSQARAQSVRDYLISRGIPAQRMRTISYGKERPVAVCNDISCWSQNRRAVTVLNASS